MRRSHSISGQSTCNQIAHRIKRIIKIWSQISKSQTRSSTKSLSQTHSESQLHLRTATIQFMSVLQCLIPFNKCKKKVWKKSQTATSQDFDIRRKITVMIQSRNMQLLIINLIRYRISLKCVESMTSTNSKGLWKRMGQPNWNQEIWMIVQGKIWLASKTYLPPWRIPISISMATIHRESSKRPTHILISLLRHKI